MPIRVNKQEEKDRIQFKIRSVFLVTSFPPTIIVIHYVGTRFIELTRTIAWFFYLKTSLNVKDKLEY